jgi:DNA-binding NarL/FixJ family response regulator
MRRLRMEQNRTEELLADAIAGRDARIHAAALDERARLAREMHDVLAHTLSALSIQLEGTRMLAEKRSSNAAVVTALDRAGRLAREGLGEARRAVGSLRGEVLPGPDLLPQLVRDFEHDTGVPCSLKIDGPPTDLGAEARLALYRIAQEALTNVRKHADPSRVDISLRYTTDAIELVVRDARASKATERQAGSRPDGTGVQSLAMDTDNGEQPVRVLIADDQALIREGLEMLLSLTSGIEVVGAASDGEEALRIAGEKRPDVVLMDLRMPRCDGVEATRRIVRDYPSIRVVVLTTYADDESIFGALDAGAMGYLTKDVGAREIQAAIRTVYDGEALLDPAVQRRLIQQLRGWGAATQVIRARAARRTHPARSRGLAPYRRGAKQPGDLGAPGSDRVHGKDSHQQHLQQGGAARQSPGGCLRHAARTDGTMSVAAILVSCARAFSPS